jgi:hypothetical protein
MSDDIKTQPIGQRPGSTKIRIVIEGPLCLKQRLEAACFEMGLTVADVGRQALWSAVMEAEANKPRFCKKIATWKMKQLEQERIR